MEKKWGMEFYENDSNSSETFEKRSFPKLIKPLRKVRSIFISELKSNSKR